MSIKSSLKNVVGAERLSTIKGQVYHYGCTAYFILKHKDKLSYDNTIVRKMAEFSSNNFHIFRGYYDLKYLSDDSRKLLCHRLPVNADSNKNTRCEIGYYDVDTNIFTQIANSSAWCWQQGSRLRWNPQNKDFIMFNDVSKGTYCTKFYDINSKKQVYHIDWPLYDLDSNCKWGISLNYSRLQRLRPGYGYNYFEDKTYDQFAPKDDGLFMIDIENNSSELIVSLDELARKIPHGNKYIHYLNHISVAPDNQHFIFFHIYMESQKKGWNTVLYVYDVVNKKYYAIEKVDRVSHYCWINNQNLMVTCHKKNGTEYYCIYNILSGKKRILKIDGLQVDGHPNKLGTFGYYVTDTYPLDKGIQRIEMFTEQSLHVQLIASLYHDYRLRGEKRCDLHPSTEKNGLIISIDTTYHNGKRSIVLFENIMEE